MNDIQDIYKMLDWDSTEEVRAEGFRLAREIRDLSLLIMPPAPVWEECAEVLCEKTDAELEPHLYSFLEWLYDLNWPGASRILDRLKMIPGKKLKGPFIECINYIYDSNNDEYLIWLDYLSELLDNKQLEAELPKEIKEKLTEKLQEYYKTCDKHYVFWRENRYLLEKLQSLPREDNMIINYANRELIDDIYLHDGYFVGFCYDYTRKRLYLEVRQNINVAYHGQIIDKFFILKFHKILYFNVKGCEFWGSSEDISCDVRALMKRPIARYFDLLDFIHCMDVLCVQ
jgi:hypothetical protein